MEECGRRMNVEIFLNAKSAVRYPASRRELGKRDRTGLVGDIFTDRDLVDESGGQELSEDLDLRVFEIRQQAWSGDRVWSRRR